MTEPDPAPETVPESGPTPDGVAAPVTPVVPEEERTGTFDPDDFVENPYKVELDIFEGPMDLLLYLIKKEEIDIYDIPIERITKHYMSYLDTFKLLNIGLAGEFLVMAVLAVAVLFMGVYPKPFTDVMDASVAELLRHVATSKLPQ